MARILINIPDEEAEEIKTRALSLGVSAPAYARQVLKDSLRRKGNNEATVTLRAIRKLIPILAEALGRTLKADQQSVQKLSQLLLEQYDQGRE
jgi:plasmid stability protein